MKIKDTEEKSEGENAEEEEGSTEADPEHSVQKEKANSPLIPPKRRKLKRKAKVKEETQELPESVDNEDKDNSNKGSCAPQTTLQSASNVSEHVLWCINRLQHVSTF